MPHVSRTHRSQKPIRHRFRCRLSSLRAAPDGEEGHPAGRTRRAWCWSDAWTGQTRLRQAVHPEGAWMKAMRKPWNLIHICQPPNLGKDWVWKARFDHLLLCCTSCDLALVWTQRLGNEKYSSRRKFKELERTWKMESHLLLSLVTIQPGSPCPRSIPDRGIVFFTNQLWELWKGDRVEVLRRHCLYQLLSSPVNPCMLLILMTLSGDATSAINYLLPTLSLWQMGNLWIIELKSTGKMISWYLDHTILLNMSCLLSLQKWESWE